MNNFPDVEHPNKSLPEVHQEQLSRLEALKEPRNASGCKTSVANYLNWLFAKTVTYEKDTVAWQAVFNGATVRTADDYLNKVAKKYADMERDATANLSRKRHELTSKISEAEDKLATLRADIDAAQKHLVAVNDTVNLANGGFHEYTNPAESSVRFKTKLDALKMEIKEMQRNKTAIIAATGFTFNNSAAQGQKFTKDFSTLMLTAYNQEVENVIVRMEKTRGRDTAISRVEKAAEKVEKLGAMLSTRINPRYHDLRIQEIETAFQFKEAEIQRKEREAEEREILREEEKARREAEKILREAEQEEKEKKAELARLLSYQQQHYSNVAGALPAEDPRIAQLQAQIAKLEAAKETANASLHNSKAGYVYVISNIGAFGEGIVKIGLTRRLVPEDRVKELSSASVPFIFDTHAIHFSPNAVELEHKLHQHFTDRRVNKVNERKEFFRVDLKEVKDALVRFSGDGATLKFDDYPEASDYRISIGQTR